MAPFGILGIVLAVLTFIFVLVFVVIGIAVPLARGLGWFFGQIGRFVIGEISDSLRLVGATVTAVVLVPLTLLSVVVGRWSASAHYGKAIQGECVAFCAALYRIVIGHPVALFHLGALTEGLQQRLPEAVKAAPGRDRPPKRVGQFEGYTIVGSLKGGGSGGKLYVARADELKMASFERQGHEGVAQVVIKSFSLKDGSTLPQIIRESRALDAAKKLGLVLDHELTNERFYYVMRFVPGDSLAIVTQRLHAQSGDLGLNPSQLGTALSYTMDVLKTLRVYHSGGLWHKDIKPDNIIVKGERANIVDLGLVTPLHSNMTLTTHGTEYFRDPELVRLALKGVKVHQVDGAKFDIYATGAVLFSMIENSFPAHGVLSRVKLRCPDAIKWIIRRAMADYDQRYASVDEMFGDLRVVADAEDAFKVKPIDLPSMGGGASFEMAEVSDEPDFVAHTSPGKRANPHTGKAQRGEQAAERSRPRLRVSNWLRGGYEVEGHDTVRVASRVGRGILGGVVIGLPGRGRRATAGEPAEARRSPRVPQEHRRSAREQVENARGRAAAARQRAVERRMARSAGATIRGSDYRNGPNLGVGIAVVALGLVVVVLVLLTGGGASMMAYSREEGGGQLGVDGALASGSGLDMPGTPVAILPRFEGPLPDPSHTSPEGTVPSFLGNSLTRTVGLAASTMGFAAEQQLRGKRALLVNEARPPYTPETEAELRDRIEKMQAQGVVVVNSPFGVSEENPEDLDVTELVAALYLIRGERLLDSRGLSDQIGEWIGGAEGVDYVVWVEPNPLEKGDVLVELFMAKVSGADLNLPLRLWANFALEQLVRPKRN